MGPDETPTPTFIPLKMTGVEEWIEGLRRVWADPHATWPHKLMATLTDPGVMLVIFVLVVGIALAVMKLKGHGSGGEVPTTAETSTSAQSTEI